MSDPQRWLDGDAPAHVRELLRAGRPTPVIDQELRGRLGQYVASAGARGAGGALVSAKVIASAAIVSVVALGAWKVTTRHPARVEPPIEAAPAPAAPLPPSVEEPAIATPPVAQPEPKATRRMPHESGAPAISELEYIERARSLIARDPAEALRLANQRAEKFPLGRLGPEAEMVAVQALERLGQNDAAKSRAERALARFPGSIYADGWRRRVESPH